MNKLIFATHNPGKIIEMRDLLSELDIEVLGAAQAGFSDEVEEDQDTFRDNAIKKALAVSGRLGEWSVADDSGLCIPALKGAPGVYTARWAGEDAGPEDLVNHTLEQLKGLDNRHAYFESALTLSSPGGQHWEFSGRVRGWIPQVPMGDYRPGLPYDVIFIPRGYDRSFAEMSDAEKNSMSHRGRAFQSLKDFLKINF